MSGKLRPERSSNRFARAVARLTAGNLLLVALAFITSPILARSLGPAGRGQVAAIFAIVTIAPALSELGITACITRQRARQSHPLGTLLGSLLPIAIAGSLIGVALAIPVAHLLGRHRPAVVGFIEIGLFVAPFGVFASTLSGVVVADERWNVYLLARVVNTVGITLAIVILSLLGDLTVRTAAATYVIWSLLGNLPFLVVLRHSRPWRLVGSLTRSGFAFGLRSWLSTIASTSNQQLDQVLMAGLLSSRQLGFYSLAVTLATASSALVGATSFALSPRVAVGDSLLAARASRVALALIIALNLVIAASSPVSVPLVFGKAFSPAIPLLLILLVASVLSIHATILGTALIAGGNPAATARAQVAGLVVTVPGLVLFIPLAGAVGAAWVSMAAYGVTFVIVLVAGRRTFRRPYRAFLLPTRSDMTWLWDRVRRAPAPG